MMHELDRGNPENILDALARLGYVIRITGNLPPKVDELKEILSKDKKYKEAFMEGVIQGDSFRNQVSRLLTSSEESVANRAL